MYSFLSPRKQEPTNHTSAPTNSIVNRITISYVSVLILIAMLFLFSYAALNDVTSNQRRIAVLINTAGRQRMFSQKIALLSFQLVQSPPGSAREDLRAQLFHYAAQMGAAHRRLVNDDPNNNLSREEFSSQIKALYFDQPFAIDTQVIDYLSAVHALTQIRDPGLDDIHLLHIVDHASGLLDAFDRLVNQYTAESITAMTILEQRERWTFISVLLLLLIVGWFIFRPMERRIRHEHLKLTNEIEERKQIELTNAQMAAIIRSSNDSIIGKTLEGIITSWNPGAERLYGYTAEEAIGKSISLLIPLGEFDELPYILKTLQQGDRIEDYETVHVHKSGRNVDVSLTVSPIQDSTGKIIGASAISRDITEQKRTKAALQKSEERFRTLVTYSPVGILQTDANGECVFANHRWSEITGFTETEALGLGWSQALHPEDREMVFAVWLTTADADREFNVEYRFQKKDGETVWVLGSIVALRNDAGDVTGFFGTITDMTDRKAIEAQLSDREERFRQLAENIDHVFWMIKSDFSEVLYISPAYEVIWGCTCESMYANPLSFLDAVHPEDRERVITERAVKMMSGDYNVEYRVIRPDGNMRWVHSRAFPVIDEDGHIYRIAGISEDITDRKKAEQQALELLVEKEKVQMLSDFIANTSHELRTPLSTINTSVYLAQKQTSVTTQKPYFEMIESRVWQLNRLIDQLHMMTKLDNENEMETTSIHVNQVIESIEASLSNQAALKQIHITYDLQPQLPAIQAQYDYFHHAIENLLENAILYTPENGTITTRTFQSADSIVIEILDSGMGITPENIDRIFDRFYKVNAARTSNSSGAGLGLTMVKKIVELHHGTIEVESTPGEGSVFRMVFPIRQPVQQPITQL